VDGEGSIEARIELIEYLGDHLLAHTRVKGVPHALCAKLGAQPAPLRNGGAARLHLPPAHCLLFDANGAAYPRIR
jgi:multiple sugar transport system ATP-binding protein